MNTKLLDNPVKNQVSLDSPQESNETVFAPGEIKARIRTLTGNITLYRQVAPSTDGDRHRESVGSSDVRISRNAENLKPENRSPRGFNGMSRAERELLEDGLVCLWMAQKSQKQLRTVFVTLTIPTRYTDGRSLTDTDHKKILSSWAEMVKRFNEEWTRLCSRHGIPAKYVYAIEPQDDRWRNYGVFAPHMHLVALNQWDKGKKHPAFDLGARASGYYSITTEDVDDIVSRVYSNLLGRAVDCSAASNIQSVGKLGKLYYYLSKLGKIGRYLSKGSKVMGEIRKSSYSGYMPKSWAGSDKETRQTVRASEERYVLGYSDLGTAKLAIENINEQFEAINGYPLFSTPHIVTVQSQNGEMGVALVFRVKNFSSIPDALALISSIDISLFRGMLLTDSC